MKIRSLSSWENRFKHFFVSGFIPEAQRKSSGLYTKISKSRKGVSSKNKNARVWS